MRRIALISLTVVGVIAAAVVAYSVAHRSHAPAARPAARGGALATLPGTVHVVRSQAYRMTTACNPHIVCHTSSFTPVTFRLPANVGKYRATLTVSFRYRASSSATGYVVNPAVVTADRKSVGASPAGPRPLLSTGGRLQSMTVVLSVPSLKGGITYGLKNDPDFAGGIHFDSNGNVPTGSISVSQVVYSLNARAA